MIEEVELTMSYSGLRLLMMWNGDLICKVNTSTLEAIKEQESEVRIENL